MTSARGISIVMPAYNEEKNLETAVTATMSSLRAVGIDYQVIIVDDKSADATAAIADQLAREHPHVSVLHHSENRGIGGAFRSGIAAADKEYVALVPADNPLDESSIREYMRFMGTCDIIVGVRVERVGYGPLMKLVSFTYNRILIPLFFNIGVSDVNWISFYRRAIFSEGVVAIEHDGIFFLVEILIKAKRRRLIIVEAPMPMRLRLHGKPTCMRPRVIWRTFKDMVSFFARGLRRAARSR